MLTIPTTLPSSDQVDAVTTGFWHSLQSIVANLAGGRGGLKTQAWGERARKFPAAQSGRRWSEGICAAAWRVLVATEPDNVYSHNFSVPVSDY